MKKVVLLVTVLAFNLSNAQKLRINEVDEFTGVSQKVTNFYNLAQTNVGLIKVSAVKLDDSYGLFLKSAYDLGCAGAVDNYVIFIFEDGNKLKLTEDISEIDCSDSAISTYIITENIDVFKNKKISKIRFSQSQYYSDGVTTGTYTLSELIKVTE